MRKIIVSVLLFALIFALFSCGTKEYSVKFDADNGNEPIIKTISNGECVAPPSEPTMVGYDFLGWYTESGEEYSFDTPVTSDLILKAKWETSVELTALIGKWSGIERTGNREYNYTLSINGASSSLELDGKMITISDVSSQKGRLAISFAMDGEVKTILFSVADALTGEGVYGGILSLHLIPTVTVEYRDGDTLVNSITIDRGAALAHPDYAPSKGTLLDGWYTEEGEQILDGTIISVDTTLVASTYTEGLIFDGEKIASYEGEEWNIVIPSYYRGVKITTIGEGAFKESEISTIALTDHITSIAAEAFLGCVELSSIDFCSVRTIGERAFFDCVAIEEIYIPDTVAEIGRGAFGSTLEYCELDGFNALLATRSELINISLPSLGEGEGAFLAYIFGADSPQDNGYFAEGKEVDTPSGEGIAHLFYYLPLALKEVTLRSALSVPPFAFYNCFYLTKINLDGVRIVGDSALEGCVDASIRGLSSVEEIGERAFLESGYSFVYMPSLKTVGDYAFAYTKVAEVEFSQTLERLGSCAFLGCDLLTDVTFNGDTPPSFGTAPFCFVDEGVTYYSMVNIWTPVGESYIAYRENVNMRDYASVIYPISTQGLEGYIVESEVLLGYRGDEVLTELSVPDGVRSIAPFAFYGNTDVVKIVMPEGFEKIGRYAFYGSTSVERLDIPSTLLEIDDYAFTGFFVGNNISRLYLPEGFRRIGEGAFMSSFNLKVIELPSTIEYIGYLAFGMSNSLERMYIHSATPPKVGSYENGAGDIYTEIFSIVNPGKTLIYVPFGRIDGVSVAETYRSSAGFSQFASYIKAMPKGDEVGFYGDGEWFIELDGCDTVILSTLVLADEDTSDMGGTKYIYRELVGTYIRMGAVILLELPELGSITAIYTDGAIRLIIDEVTYNLVEPRYYYDSYNWTSFRLYPREGENGGLGVFDMNKSFITPFSYRIEGDKFYISIDGNNKLPEHADYAGVREYEGTYDEKLDMFRVDFMLNDYEELMRFTAQRNTVSYAGIEEMRLYGVYKAYAEGNPDYAMFTLVSHADGSVDVYIGESGYMNCPYTVDGNKITIDVMSLLLTFTMDKNGDLDGDFFGTPAHLVYADELLDSTKLPSREDGDQV